MYNEREGPVNLKRNGENHQYRKENPSE